MAPFQPEHITRLFKALTDGRPIDIIREAFDSPSTFALIGLLDRQLFLKGSRVHFDEVAESYLRQVSQSEHMLAALDWQLRQLPPIFEALMPHWKRSEDIVVTELGAGIGAVSAWPTLQILSSKSISSQRIALTCYDVSERMKSLTFGLKVEDVPPALARRLGDDLPRVVGDVNRCQYRLQDFTDPDFLLSRAHNNSHVVICSFVMHHLGMQSKYEAANCIKRMLRPRGIAVVVDEFRTLGQNLQEIAHAERNGASFALECFMPQQAYESMFSDVGLIVKARKQLCDGRTIAFALASQTDGAS